MYWIVATGFSRSLFYKEKGLDFRLVLWKVLYLSARKQTSLDDMIFITYFGGNLQPAYHKTVCINTASLVQQATLERLTHVLFLTDLYLECSYKDLRCLCMAIENKINPPEETRSDFLYPFPNV